LVLKTTIFQILKTIHDQDRFDQDLKNGLKTKTGLRTTSLNLGKGDYIWANLIEYGQGLASPKTFYLYSYAANAQYLSDIAGIDRSS